MTLLDPSALRLLRGAIAVVLVAAAAACGGAQIPADARTTVVSLQKIDCADCGLRIVQDLRTRPGIYKASFDKRSAEIRVVSSPSFDVFTEVRRLAANEGFQAILGAGLGKYLEGPAFPEGADAAVVVKDGMAVPELATVVVKGKVTVVDFSAMWCEPCRKVDEHMIEVLRARKDVAYRKLDIGDWDTPLAKRYLGEVSALPYVIVFDKAGARVTDVKGVNNVQLDAAIARGSGP